LVFFITGVEETARVNGNARIVTDTEKLQEFEVKGTVLCAAILIDVAETYLHCGRR